MFQYINTVILNGNPMLALGRKNIFEVGKKYRINLRLTKEYERVHRIRCRQGHVLFNII